MALTFNDRIELLIKTLGYNPNSFAVALGYKGNNKIQRLIKTDNNPSYELLKDINDMFVNVNIEWLIGGKGDMLKTASGSIEDNPEYRELQKKYIACLEEKDALKKIGNAGIVDIGRKTKLKKP